MTGNPYAPNQPRQWRRFDDVDLWIQAAAQHDGLTLDKRGSDIPPRCTGEPAILAWHFKRGKNTCTFAMLDEEIMRDNWNSIATARWEMMLAILGPP